MHLSTTYVLISLGGNKGNVPETFRAAIELLARTPGVGVSNVSGFAATAPVQLSAPSSDPYLNAALRAATSLSPEAILEQLQAIETRLGRVRERRWGPRTIDLDLLFFGQEVIETERLRVPHPAAWYRRFVLDPLAEIAPDFVHPVKQLTVKELRDRLLPRPLTIGLAEPGPSLREQAKRLQTASVRFSDWNPGDPQPTFLVWCGDPGDPRFQSLPRVPRLVPWPEDIPIEDFLRVLVDSVMIDSES